MIHPIIMDIAVPSPPFSEQEKRMVIAEAIKTSTIPLNRLLELLQEGNVVPQWEHMLLPHGRTLKACKDAYESLRPAPLLPFASPSLSITGPSSSHKRTSEGFDHFSAGSAPKRRQSGVDVVTVGREIRPKQASNGSPLSMTSLPEPKKRGRPPKAELQRRQAAAIARGDIIPPASMALAGHQGGDEFGGYAPIAPTPPLLAPAPAKEQSPMAPVEKGTMENSMADPSTKKKRAPTKTPSKAKPPRHPGESSFELNPQIPTNPVEEPTVPAPVENVQTAPAGSPVESPNKPPTTEAVTLAEPAPPKDT